MRSSSGVPYSVYTDDLCIKFLLGPSQVPSNYLLGLHYQNTKFRLTVALTLSLARARKNQLSLSVCNGKKAITVPVYVKSGVTRNQ